MKIKVTKNKEKVSDIIAGTVFKDDEGKVYMKTMWANTQYGLINAITLDKGTFCSISGDDLVTIYPNAELTL